MIGTENVVVTQATVGLAFSSLLAWLKSAKWLPWVNEHSAVINHSILVITSAFGALGVHMAWSASSHSLTITGLDLTAIGASVWILAKQWTVQFLVHRGVFGSVATPAAGPNPYVPQQKP